MSIRRRFTGLSFALASLLACAVPAWAQDEPKVLNIYNWSDFIGKDTVREFEKETGIQVRYDNYDSDEILHAKLVAGHTGYDIVIPSLAWAKIQAEGGLLAKVDRSKLSNWKNLDPNILRRLAVADPGNAHLVPWLWGYTAVGVNTDKVKAAISPLPMPANPWDLVFKPEYTSKLKSCGISFLDSADDLFSSALLYLGRPISSKEPADYRDAFNLMSGVRQDIALFSSSGYINDLASGAVCIVIGWSGDINIARQRAIEANRGVNIEVLLSKTGQSMYFDTMAIPADAPHPGNALLWLNYIMRPEVHAGLTNAVFYANPNLASLPFVKKEIAQNPTVFPPAEVLADMQMQTALPPAIRRLQNRFYTKLKTGI